MRRWTTHPARRPDPGAPPAWVEALSLGLPLVVLAALSLYQLGALSLWRDEVASVVFAHGSLGDLLTLIGRDRYAVDLPNMATYYLILHFWLAFGDSETWLRLPSVVFGVATIIPVYAIGRRLGGLTLGALAAGILALFPLVIHHSREVRSYSLSMLVAATLTWLLLVGVERRDRIWPWLAYGVVAALGIYVHFFVTLVVATHGVWVLATRQLPSPSGILAALVPIGFASVPIPFIFMEFGDAQEWIPPLSGPSAAHALTALAGSAPLLLALSLVVAYVLVTLSHDRRAWLLVASVLLPIAGAAVISLAKPVFVGRYLIVVLPPLALLAAWGIASIPQRLLGTAAAVLLGVMLVTAMPSAFRDTRQQDWRSAGDWVAERSQEGDAMIARNGRRALAYYVAAFGGSVPQNTNVRVALRDAGPDRVWVAVLGEVPPGQEADVPRRLSARYEVAERHTFGRRLSILLMTRTPFD